MDSPATHAGGHIALLHRISSMVSSDQDLETILTELVALAANVTQSDSCLVYLIDHVTDEIVLRASQLEHPSEIGHVRMKMGEGVTGWVAAHHAVVALPRKASEDSRFKKVNTLPEDSFEAFLSVPLVDGGTLIGVINVQHREVHEHSTDEVALMTFVGEQMGGLIGRARLAEQSQSANRRMETLAAVAHTIGAESYLDRILQAISEMVAETLDCAICSIMLVDEETKELTVSAARCSSPDYMHRMPIRMEGSLIEQVVRDAQTVAIDKMQDDKRFKYPELARRTGLTSAMATPLISQGKVMGTINIYTREKRVFQDDEIGFLKAVAGQAAIAIQNARLMSETLEMKRTLETRKLVERAKGILQSRHGLTEEEAYLRLRNESRRLRRSMRDLAEAVILADDLNRKEGGPPAPRQPAVREDFEIM
ncbi:MAG TPA: GAF and ANTAR domain-containing protein [Bryobacteraceae bacterium]|nr:GAF and ANTAR domain-containing protein [Bryobacteraceae bacterium]